MNLSGVEMSGAGAPAFTATPIRIWPSGVMAVTWGRSTKSVEGSTTTSPWPAFSAAITLSRDPPPTVTGMPVRAV